MPLHTAAQDAAPVPPAAEAPLLRLHSGGEADTEAGAEALRLPVPKDSDAPAHAELHEYAGSGGSNSGSVSRTSSAAGDSDVLALYCIKTLGYTWDRR